MRGLGLDLWERALQGYLSKLDASRSGLGVKWHFHIFTEKASRTRKYLFTPCLEPTEILAFFCYACVCFLSFFLSLCIFWPLPYWEGTCQLAGRMHRLRWRWAFLHKQTRGLLTCTEAANELWRRPSPRTVVDSRCTLLSHFGLLV